MKMWRVILMWAGISVCGIGILYAGFEAQKFFTDPKEDWTYEVCMSQLNQVHTLLDKCLEVSVHAKNKLAECVATGENLDTELGKCLQLAGEVE